MPTVSIRKALVVLITVGAAFAISPSGIANHATGTLSSPVGNPLSEPPTKSNGDWEFIANFPAGAGTESPIGVDVEKFTRKLEDGVHRYVITSSMTIGFSIFDVTDPASPQRVADYGAAACGPEANVQEMMEVLAGGHDFAAGSSALGVVHGWEHDIQITPNGKIAILASDARGRCHDPGFGGMEFVDVSDPADPKLLGLVRLQGESHNTTIDLDRPWIVYNSNSDSASNNFIDIVDFKSCLALDPTKCLPQVSRYQMKKAWTTGTKTLAPSACHDITYMRHKLYGACINTTLILDPSNVLRKGHLTGTKLTSKSQVGDKACTKAAPSPEALVDLQVIDCSSWTIEKWKSADARNAHLRLLSLMRHPGKNLSEDARGKAGIQISHKADPVSKGRLVAINDERGGGLNPGPGPRPGRCGGGIWFYDVRDRKNPVVARRADGRKAIFFPGPKHIVNTEGSNCTSHVFWEWKGVKHLISAAWYSSGTQLFRYKANFKTHPATVKFYGKKTFVPPGASTWTSRIYRQQNNEDGSKTLFFVATDIARGFDFFKLTLPNKS